MSVYRDDLTAARERIRALESELQSLQRRDDSSMTRTDVHNLARPGQSHATTAVALIGAVFVAVFALRVPVLAPIAIVSVLFGVALLALRGKSIVVRPNQVAILRPKRADASAPPVWIGPGRMARLKRPVSMESLSLCAAPVSWTASTVRTRDGSLDADLFAIVAVRRDEEGIERAVRTFGGGPISPITQAALEDALRRCARDVTTADVRGRDAGFRDRLRRLGREALDELGVKLVMIGLIDTREGGVSS